MELFLTLKLYLHETELFNIEFFLTFNYVLTKPVLIPELAELELFE